MKQVTRKKAKKSIVRHGGTDAVMVIGKVVQVVLVRELGKDKAEAIMKRIAEEIHTLQA